MFKDIIPERELVIYEVHQNHYHEDANTLKNWKRRLRSQINPKLPTQEQNSIFKILIANEKAFAKELDDLEKVQFELCLIKIDIGKEPVPYSKSYPQSLDRRERMKKAIQKLLDAKITEESYAEKGSLVFFVKPKKKRSYSWLQEA